MQSIKTFYKLTKVSLRLEEIFSIGELNFVKDYYVKDLINSIFKLKQHDLADLNKIFATIAKKCITKPALIVRLLSTVHSVLQARISEEVDEILVEVVFSVCKQLSAGSQMLNELDMYVINSLCLPYAKYLLKAFAEQNRGLSSHHYSNGQASLEHQANKNAKIHQQFNFNSEQFNMLNIISSISQLSLELHKMGRYYPDHQYVMNLYQGVLRDFETYFPRVKATFENCLKKVKGKKCQLSQVTSMMLFMKESERCVDLMKEFYYNKYFYYYFDDKIVLKMDLEVPEGVIKKEKVVKKRKLSNSLSEDGVSCTTTQSRVMKHGQCIINTEQSESNLRQSCKLDNKSSRNNEERMSRSLAEIDALICTMDDPMAGWGIDNIEDSER